mmetsp:Transcript_49300/g.128620  ORF Transcript_49300/g.128620 Transcript_49300/m.128620 type:complete len:212 (-) Transcript_49300:591-1226(-)
MGVTPRLLCGLAPLGALGRFCRPHLAFFGSPRAVLVVLVVLAAAAVVIIVDAAAIIVIVIVVAVVIIVVVAIVSLDAPEALLGLRLPGCLETLLLGALGSKPLCERAACLSLIFFEEGVGRLLIGRGKVDGIATLGDVLRLDLNLSEEPLAPLLQCNNLGRLGQSAQRKHHGRGELGKGNRMADRVQMLREEEESFLHEPLLVHAFRRVGG